MTPHYVHPRLLALGNAAELLVDAAALAAKAAVKTYRQTRRPRSYNALQPGPSTPLWNELAAACSRHFKRRGDKARLARILGVPRQRVHLLLVAKTACPDAERTLLLLTWLQLRQRGSDLY